MNYIRYMALPTRPQPDTIVAILLLREFAKERFSGIQTAQTMVLQEVTMSAQEYEAQGILLLDVGDGLFDHHTKVPKTTASRLVAEYLEIQDNPIISKLLQYAERDDFMAKGTLSSDPLDRAFGMSALIAAVNKQYPQNPHRVVVTILPLLEAHLYEQRVRAEELPREVEERKSRGELLTFEIRQLDKKLSVVMIKSQSPSMVGYLRSAAGGRFDIVLQMSESGHVNIMTRPLKKPDLRDLAAAVRFKESEKAGVQLDRNKYFEAARPGKIDTVKEWYYDTATNSLLNGGVHPQEIEPTKIVWDEWKDVLIRGLEYRNPASPSPLANDAIVRR